MNARQFLLKAENKLFHTNDKRYRSWFLSHRVSAETLCAQRAVRFETEPLVSILVPVYKTPVPFLREMIESVLRQSYGRFELILANASPEVKELSEVLSEYGEKDRRIKVVDLPENGGISRNTNEAFRHAEGEFTALFDHDDLLEPDALYAYVSVLNEKPESEVFYCDEDKVTEAGNDWFFPNFKPDLSPAMLRSTNYICHFLMLRTELFRKLGGLDPRFDGAQDYDLVLRAFERTKNFVHVPRILYHWRSHAASTAKSMDTKNYAADAGKRALKAHLERLGIRAEVLDADNPGWFHIDPELPKGTIREIVLPRGNTGEKLKMLLNAAGASGSEEYTLIREEGTEALSEAQKALLLARFAFPETGAAGPRLLYAGGMTESAGIHIRKDGRILHFSRGEETGKPGYMCRAITASNVQALSFSCILVRTEILREWLRERELNREAPDPFRSGNASDKLAAKLGLFMQENGLGFMVMEPRALVRTDRKEPALGFSEAWMGKRVPEIPEDPFYNPNFSETRPFLV